MESCLCRHRRPIWGVSAWKVGVSGGASGIMLSRDSEHPGRGKGAAGCCRSVRPVQLVRQSVCLVFVQSEHPGKAHLLPPTARQSQMGRSSREENTTHFQTVSE